MPDKITWSTQELELLSLFQRVSGVTARDCVIDNKMNRVIFLVNPNEIGLAIGRKGSCVRALENIIKKPVEIVAYSEDPVQLIKNVLNPKYISEVRLSERADGSKIAIVVLVSPRFQGAVVGLGGKHAEKARLLVRRYFDIADVRIVAQT
ncbi:MAG: NusA-like transcription termination signal-binding factor [Nitrososphaeria archaeon]|nr:NusA-like transcription termination signal-binding factor [Nitrososphaeria archaeon]